MKKVLLLLVALLLVGSLALAESIDLNSLTDDELLALREKVEQAIDERGISEGKRLPNGKYVAGSDIKPGKYIIHARPGKHGGQVVVYKDKDHQDYNGFISNAIIDKKSSRDIFISLEDGNLLHVMLGQGSTITEVDMF